MLHALRSAVLLACRLLPFGVARLQPVAIWCHGECAMLRRRRSLAVQACASLRRSATSRAASKFYIHITSCRSLTQVMDGRDLAEDKPTPNGGSARFHAYSPALQNLPQNTTATPKCKERGEQMSQEEQVRLERTRACNVAETLLVKHCAMACQHARWHVNAIQRVFEV